jgi:uncharacterized membrane protein YphA (DoxX/SURF4 family)
METTATVQTNQTDAENISVSKKMLWTGRIVSSLPVLVLIMSAVMKFAKPPPVVEGFAHLGLPVTLAFGLGVLELACTAIYVIPRTAVLGAILLTGYLGGAVVAHLRVGDPFIGPCIFGVLIWAGLFFREPRLRALIPLRSLPPAAPRTVTRSKG